MKIKIAAFLIIYKLIFCQASGDQTFFNIMEYGATNDGNTKNTLAIQKAIEAAVKKGGGTVYFPAGKYLTGPIHLKDNITLYLEGGAVLKFSKDIEDYLPLVQSRWEGTEVINFSPQIYAYKAENIKICGRGLIDGQGDSWWEYWRQYERRKGKDKKEGNLIWQKEFVEKNQSTPSWEFWKKKRGKMLAPFLRPSMIQPFECKNVIIEDVSLKDPPMWTVHPVYCENVTINAISINNPAHSPNTDGINPDACRYVHISNCHINAGDDCITIKSGRDADGRCIGRACENVTITNCTILAGHGGVVIGSEMSGSVRKITITNCVFDGTDRGIRIKSMRGRGGIVEEIRVNNIVMKNILKEAIELNMFYHMTPDEPVSERTPQFRNIHLSNITVSESHKAGFLLGLPEMPIENITFSNINIQADKGFEIRDVQDIEFHNVQVITKEGPILVAEKIDNLELDGVKTLKPHKNTAAVEFKNVQNVFIHDCSPISGTDIFLALSGDENKNIIMDGNNFSMTSEPVKMPKDVAKEVIIRE